VAQGILSCNASVDVPTCANGTNLWHRDAFCAEDVLSAISGVGGRIEAVTITFQISKRIEGEILRMIKMKWLTLSLSGCEKIAYGTSRVINWVVALVFLRDPHKSFHTSHCQFNTIRADVVLCTIFTLEENDFAGSVCWTLYVLKIVLIRNRGRCCGDCSCFSGRALSGWRVCGRGICVGVVRVVCVIWIFILNAIDYIGKIAVIDSWIKLIIVAKSLAVVQISDLILTKVVERTGAFDLKELSFILSNANIFIHIWRILCSSDAH
jgi:hypothetical protein